MSGGRGGAKERREAAQARRARRAAVDDPEVVMEAAAAFLALRPRSVAETRRRLRDLGYPPDLNEQVLERLVRVGYLDDRAFARAWVESRDRVHPRGSLALRQELLLKGVTREIADEILAERAEVLAHPEAATAGDEGADLLAARRLLERKASVIARETDPRRRRQKAYALLARHGFPPDVCRRAAPFPAAADITDVAEDGLDEGV